jgi:hypothetical protein
MILYFGCCFMLFTFHVDRFLKHFRRLAEDMESASGSSSAHTYDSSLVPASVELVSAERTTESYLPQRLIVQAPAGACPNGIELAGSD